jgi:alkyl sulfatase BDS1-like metallo-beta-lactamase superfamily hydrolase
MEVDGCRVELHHARGETDDHTWVFLPDRKVLYPGDLFIWCVPNAGNPQKVQRYALDWAVALRDMAAKGAELFVPSHGLPIRGADRIRVALVDTATVLETLHDQTVELMNQGCSLNDVIHQVEPPQDLLEKPYLTPIYDEPEFIVRNVWRYYGGWHDGNPANLKPAREADLAAEIASLAGGPHVLAERASALLARGDLRVAAHLAELAHRAAPGDADVHRVRADVFTACQSEATSLMAKGIYGAAVRESREAATTTA